MIYTEYANAAERHQETCVQLLHILDGRYKSKEIASGLSARERKEKVELLGNLYYLSGYIIECAYSYAICKHIGLNLADSPKNQLRSVQIGGVTWSPNNTSRYGASHALTRIGHKMSVPEMSYFSSGPGSVAGVSSIPIIGGSDMSTPTTRNLFDNWSAEIRYSIGFPLDYSEVFDFFWECEKIHRETRRLICSEHI